MMVLVLALAAQQQPPPAMPAKPPRLPTAWADTSPDARFAARGFQGGFVLDGVRAVRRTGGRAVRRVTLATTINGTVMRIELDQPLPPGGGVVSLDLGFSFQVPEHGADRMGRELFPEGSLYEIAQWYPRMAVYDQGSRFVYVRQYPSELITAEIDPEKRFPDVRRGNNAWSKQQTTDARP